MPKKKFVPVPFFPKSESQNIDEPEHFNYGIYFNDGYDYMQHLIGLEDFKDQTTDLKEIIKTDKIKSNVLQSQSINRVTVLKEVQYDNEGNDSLENIKTIIKDELDEEILNGLDSDAELSELEDDFIKLADMKEIANQENDEEIMKTLDNNSFNEISEKPAIKGDKGIFSQFFGNNIMDDEENDSATNSHYDLNNVKMATNDISEAFLNQIKFRIPEPVCSTKGSFMSKSLMCAYEQDKDYGKAKLDFKVDLNDAFYRNLDRNETEFDPVEIDKAVDRWSYRQPKVTTNALHKIDVVSKYQPKLITIEKPKKRVHESINAVDKSESGDEVMELARTDVSQFHVQRPQNETGDERRSRKGAIKEAKRARREEKKINKQFFK